MDHFNSSSANAYSANFPRANTSDHIRANINLDAIKKNILGLREITSKKARFMAVVKANAYGHGALEVAKKAVDSGADQLGVARLKEAVPLRMAGIDTPISIFGFTHPAMVKKAHDLSLTVTVYNLETAKLLSDEAARLGITLTTHLKVDTGMGRVGLLPDSLRPGDATKGEALSEVEKMLRLPCLDFEGIYTHFASADTSDKSYTRFQLGLFNTFIDELHRAGIQFQLRHAANSAAIIDHPDAHFEMVRAGISLYGLYPSQEVDKTKVLLTPAMELNSFITSLKRVPKGFKISYAMTHETDKETVIASVPAGYADGYPRLLSSKGAMLVRGTRAPIVGRVCMDQTLIDVGHIPGVKTGDRVTLLGCQGDACITADEIAALTGTINYEIVSSLTARVPKIF